MNVTIKSKELLLVIDECKNRFDQIKQKPEKTEALFYEHVRPTFDRIMALTVEWKPLATEWVVQNKPKYIHATQLDSTIDNIEQIVLQSFYKDINHQRFNNLYHSVEYVIQSILSQSQSQ